MKENKQYINLGMNVLIFVMGQACNLRCKYCLKNTMTNEQLSTEISDDVLDYLKWLAYNSEKSITVNYYGGEPLVYLDGIKQIVEYCDKLNEESGRNIFSHAMISNGKLLTQDLVDYINEHNITYTLSYDGYNSEYTRGFDSIKERGDLAIQIKTLGLTGVVTSKNYPLDMCNAFQEFDNKFFEKWKYHVRLNFDDLMDTGEGIEFQELLNIDHEKYMDNMNKLFDIYEKSILDKKEDHTHYVHSTYCQIIINNINGYLVSDGCKTSRCNQGIDVINMDLDGYMYDCHNITDGKLGHINDDPARITRALIASEYPIMHRLHTICKDCEAIAVCSGGCKYISDDKLESICNIYKIKYSIFSNRIIDLYNRMEE